MHHLSHTCDLAGSISELLKLNSSIPGSALHCPGQCNLSAIEFAKASVKCVDAPYLSSDADSATRNSLLSASFVCAHAASGGSKYA